MISKSRSHRMFAADQIQSLASLAEAVVTLFLNTENANPSPHPKLPGHLAWLRKYKAVLEQGTSAPDAKRVRESMCPR
jgi:hypothetical protein